MPEFVIATLMMQKEQNICPDNYITAMQEVILWLAIIAVYIQHCLQEHNAFDLYCIPKVQIVIVKKINYSTNSN